MSVLILILSVAFVAFTNGANANFKGVASLYGSGTASLRRALLWGTAATFAGSIAAAFLAREMVGRFGGRGLVPDGVAQSPRFVAAVALGAAMTSLLANRLGFPVSTTHALVGALTGAGMIACGSEVRYGGLGKNFLYPLAFSPLVAMALGAIIFPVLRFAHMAPEARSPVLDFMHYLSAGAASFARGLNDTPKMVALLALAPEWGGAWGFWLVASAIAAGGLLDADKVAETLGRKITTLNPGEGFAASLVTAGLVTTASLHGLPVSTTHVSVGALLGIGAGTGQARWRKAGEILLAWCITLPCGAVMAMVDYFIVGSLAQAE